MPDENIAPERSEALKIWQIIIDDVGSPNFDESVSQDIRFMQGTMGDGLVALLEHCITNWWRLSHVRHVLSHPALPSPKQLNREVSSKSISIERVSMEVIRNRLLDAITKLATCYHAHSNEKLDPKSLRKDCVSLWRDPDNKKIHMRFNRVIALLRDWQQKPFSMLSAISPFQMQPSLEVLKKRRALKASLPSYGVATGIRMPTRRMVWKWDEDKKPLTLVAEHFSNFFVKPNGKHIKPRTIKEWSKTEGWSIQNPDNHKEKLVLRDVALEALACRKLLSD